MEDLREARILKVEEQSLKLGSTDTLFGVSYPCQTCIRHLKFLRHFCMHVPTKSFFLNKKKMQNTAGTRQHEKSNTLSQNKENIHSLNSNSAFENLINIFILEFYSNFQTSCNSKGFALSSIITLSLIYRYK